MARKDTQSRLGENKPGSRADTLSMVYLLREHCRSMHYPQADDPAGALSLVLCLPFPWLRMEGEKRVLRSSRVTCVHAASRLRLPLRREN
eukprot:2578960-Pleurochrysis_carterae.AAC.1